MTSGGAYVSTAFTLPAAALTGVGKRQLIVGLGFQPPEEEEGLSEVEATKAHNLAQHFAVLLEASRPSSGTGSAGLSL
jgi:hypothetical protein